LRQTEQKNPVPTDTVPTDTGSQAWQRLRAYWHALAVRTPTLLTEPCSEWRQVTDIAEVRGQRSHGVPTFRSRAGGPRLIASKKKEK
jgi:hypothetical protein